MHTDPAVVLPQPDGDAAGRCRRDLDATAEEVARWSRADAEALRGADAGSGTAGWRRRTAGVSSGLPRGATTTPAERYEALRRRSAWDVIHERFQHPTVRSLMTWLAFATIQDPHRPGTGVLPASITSGRLRFGWATPVGGSGALPDGAACGLVEAHGGRSSPAAR